MKQFFGYALLVTLIVVLWGASYMIYTDSGDMLGVGISFGFGALFASLLVFSIGYELRKVRRRYIVEEDYAEIMTDLYRIEKLAENHYYIHTRWQDEDGGAEYFFKSDYILFDPERFVRGRKIPVKISQQNYKLYYVDLSFLPKLA